jgi:chemotaxis protein MotB
MPETGVAPIIIKKKKGGHGGHHGGAWKVAYADFVTAMMALFIVLWLMNSSVQVRKAISAYFRDPSGTGKLAGSASGGTGESVSVSKADIGNLKNLLEQAIKKSPELAPLQDYVQMSVTGDGLRVELLESENGIFFQSSSSTLSMLGEEMIAKLAHELAKFPNPLMIEGHTDSKPFRSQSGYTNWELSTDRANAARRLIEANGVPPGRVVQVRGFADHNLRVPANPEDASNRRISVIVRYENTTPEDEPDKEAAGGEKSGGEKKGGEKSGGEKNDGEKNGGGKSDTAKPAPKPAAETPAKH